MPLFTGDIDLWGVVIGVVCYVQYRVLLAASTFVIAKKDVAEYTASPSPSTSCPEPDEEPSPSHLRDNSARGRCSSAEALDPTPAAAPAYSCGLRRLHQISIGSTVLLFVAAAAASALTPAILGYQPSLPIASDSSSAPLLAAGGASDGNRTKPRLAISLTRQRMTVQGRGDDEGIYVKSAYYGTLKVGTPAKPYSFVFDTGSGHLVLPSGYCHSRTCKAHRRYKRSTSKTAVDIDADGRFVKPDEARDQITVQFGTGQISGVFVDDVVCMEVNATSFVAKDGHEDLPPGCMRMRLIAATDMSQEPFMAFNFDGILGLGLSGLSQAPQFNFMQVLAGPIQQWAGDMSKTFAFFLSENQELESSELSLGGWDQDRLEGGLSWNGVVQPELGHWMIKVKSIRVDDEVIDFCSEGLECKAVVDTGTSLVAVPPEVFPALYQSTRHDAAPDGLCQGPGPNLVFELEDFNITLGPEDYAQATWHKQNASSWNSSWSSSVNSTGRPTRADVYCRPLLMSVPMQPPLGPKLFIFGEPVLRRYYTVFDADLQRVGFGRSHHKSSEPTATLEEAESTNVDDSWWHEDEDEDDEP